MSPHPAPTIEALSGISGSISIACWVVVFSPQIIENFRRGSSEGLSISFIIIWLLGDVFNILGAVLQNVLPTMTILAVYYTLADVVLLGQCFWYEGFRLWDRKEVERDEQAIEDVDERSSLLPAVPTPERSPNRRPKIGDVERGSRGSYSSVGSRSFNGLDATRLNPATLIPPQQPMDTPAAAETLKPRSRLKSFAFNVTALVFVCGAGALGWWLSSKSAQGYPSGGHHPVKDPNVEPISTKTDSVRFDVWGQIFGYLCAVLYLGSRIPQLLLNYRRKSTEGVSMLFFLFACVGNLTYVMSIFFYEPACAGLEEVGFDGGCRDGEWSREYGKYILVNTSWLVGSAGTLLLDFLIFVQFFLYRDNKKANGV